MFKKVAGRMRLDPENVTHVRLHSSVIVTRYSATISGEKVRPLGVWNGFFGMVLNGLKPLGVCFYKDKNVHKNRMV